MPQPLPSPQTQGSPLASGGIALAPRPPQSIRARAAVCTSQARAIAEELASHPDHDPEH